MSMDVKRTKIAEKNFPAFLKDSVEKMRSTGSAETVFGPARKENGRTIIPVARVAYGFGGGYGTAGQKGKAGAKQRGAKTSANGDSGLGGGGGMRVIPAGMFEVTADGARFLPVRGSLATTAIAVAGGVLLGSLLGRRGRSGGKKTPKSARSERTDLR
jgi:uncharacterized spore protein YtfJ